MYILSVKTKILIFSYLNFYFSSVTQVYFYNFLQAFFFKHNAKHKHKLVFICKWPDNFSERFRKVSVLFVNIHYKNIIHRPPLTSPKEHLNGASLSTSLQVITVLYHAHLCNFTGNYKCPHLEILLQHTPLLCKPTFISRA